MRILNYPMNNSLRLPICLLLAIVLLMASAPLGMASIYDPVGNRLTKTEDGIATSYTYDTNDRLLTEDGTTYSYDTNGNMVAKAGAAENVTYDYDFENQLIEVTTSGTSVAYSYDSDGIRVQMTVDGSEVINYLVDKNRPYAQVLEERDGSNTLLVNYTYGDDLISQDRGGVDSYYHYDGQLSTRALSDSSQTVTDTYTYDAFGNLLAQTGTTENNYLYTGEQYDPNVGFYYLRARYYDAGVGRFITTDPWSGSAYDPPSLHKYLYAGADPIDNWDPSGMMTKEEELNYVAIMGKIVTITGLSFMAYMQMVNVGTIDSPDWDIDLDPIGEWTKWGWMYVLEHTYFSKAKFGSLSHLVEYEGVHYDTGFCPPVPNNPSGRLTEDLLEKYGIEEHSFKAPEVGTTNMAKFDIVRDKDTKCVYLRNKKPPYYYIYMNTRFP